MSFWTIFKKRFTKKKPKRRLPLHIKEILETIPPKLNIGIKTPRFVVFDTETTGLKKEAELVAIGALGITKGRVVLSDMFYELIQPRAEIPAPSIFVHGITPSMVEDRPKADEILIKFIEYCGQDILVGYQAGFDLMFINKEMENYFGIRLPNITLDVLKLFLFIKKPYDNYSLEPQNHDLSLDAVAKELGVPLFDRHSVIGDVLGTAMLFQKLLTEAEDKNMTLKDLVRIAKV